MNISSIKGNAFNLLVLLLTVMLVPLRLKAQDEFTVPSAIPPVVKQAANRIQNPSALKSFYSKMRSLENGDSVNVKILHIGDSHIYADLLTGMVRQLFQKRFGKGGTKQLYRFRPADFQDTLRTSYIIPLATDSIKGSGVCYYIAGANGAEYSTYNQKADFFKETSLLQPDLVIISMGTNEAFGNLEQDIFENNIDAFVSQIRCYNPHAAILITTPGDALKKKRLPNANIEKACAMLINYASISDVAVWDLNAVMGGEGSMKKWFKAGLSQKDRIHFSREGYYIQGFLLFKALMDELDKPST